MGKLDEIAKALDNTLSRYTELVNSIPEADYALPTENPAWSVGDILFHITLGPRALAVEIWMMRHAPKTYQFLMNTFPMKLFNWGNALLGKQGRRFRRGRLLKAYEAGHARLRSALRRLKEEDLSRSLYYPEDFVSELAGEVSIERLLQYASEHFEMHKKQLGEVLKNRV